MLALAFFFFYRSSSITALARKHVSLTEAALSIDEAFFKGEHRSNFRFDIPRVEDFYCVARLLARLPAFDSGDFSQGSSIFAISPSEKFAPSSDAAPSWLREFAARFSLSSPPSAAIASRSIWIGAASAALCLGFDLPTILFIGGWASLSSVARHADPRHKLSVDCFLLLRCWMQPNAHDKWLACFFPGGQASPPVDSRPC